MRAAAAKPRHRESAMQREIVATFDRIHGGLGVLHAHLLFAIPNGGKRTRIEACILKGEGVRAGVPDLFLAVARGGYHGLFLELKTEKGRISEAQLEMHARLAKQHYFVAVPRSVGEAVEIIGKYLNF